MWARASLQPAPHPPCPSLKVVLLSAWGGGEEVGLTGVQIYDADHHPADLLPSHLSIASACSHTGNTIMHTYPSLIYMYVAPLDVLVDGVYKTTSDGHMWKVSDAGKVAWVVTCLSLRAASLQRSPSPLQ